MNAYQHFRKDEQGFVDYVLDVVEQVDRQYITRFTDFLDPREQFIFTSLIGKDERFNLIPAFENDATERQMYGLSPYYESIDVEDFPYHVLEASYPVKFVSIEHPDLLGAFLSLGISRKKLGDISIDEDSGIIQIVVGADISAFVMQELTQVKKAHVQFSPVDKSTFSIQSAKWKDFETTVSSLRLDVFVKSVYRMSRSQAKEYIQKGLVKLNFKVVEDPSEPIEPGDLISVRKKGRSRLESIEGQTKKEKYRILYQLMEQ